MQKHIPDVPIEVESGWMFNWNKKGTHKLIATKEGGIDLVPYF
jgi:hypothetical protein